MPMAGEGSELIFVTGASRSGTTMLARILGNAPECLCLRELHFYGDLVPIGQAGETLQREQAERVAAMLFARQRRDFWAKAPDQADIDSAKAAVAGLESNELTGDAVFSACIQAILAEAGARRACEQTPRNIYYARHLLEVFPAAHVVSVVRDPRGVMASQKKRHQLRKLGGGGVPLAELLRLAVNYHPITMTRLWRGAVGIAHGLRAHERFHIVRYEDLVGAAGPTVEKLCGALGLGYDESYLNVPHWGSSVTTHTSKAGLSSQSLNKWQAVLNDTEVKYCERATETERGWFGYERFAEAKWSLTGMLSFVLKAPVHVLGLAIVSPRRTLVQLKAMFAKGGRA